MQSKIIKYYPSIETLEKKNLVAHSNDKYYIEEKIDGSQLGFMLNNNELCIFNRKKVLTEPSGIYDKQLLMLPLIKDKLENDLIYFGEAINSLKTNVVVYQRIPKFYFILYDIYSLIDKRWFTYCEKKNCADKIGLECVPLLYEEINDANADANSAYDKCLEFIKKIENGELESYLGGVPEGVVIKRSGAKFKMVSNQFKERHVKKQKKIVWLISDFLKYVGEQFNTEARFQKAYQHLREDGIQITLINIVNELDKDLYKEYEKEINGYIVAECTKYIEHNKLGVDPMADEILEIVQHHKQNTKYDSEQDLKEKIINILCDKYRPIICNYARSSLDQWFSLQQFQ